MCDPSLPTPVFVLMSPLDATGAFLTAHAVDDGAPPIGVADPEQVLHRAFGVPRGGWREMFGVRTWRAGVRAVRGGHRIGRKVGDGWTMPVWIVLEGDRVTWHWVGSHAGDRPALDEVPRRSPA